MKTFVYLFVFLFGLTGLPVLAQEATLYEHRVAVPDESDEAMAKARRRAMEVVLIKLSGDSAVARQPGVTEALAEAGSYVSRFGYQQDNTADGPQLYLWVAFDPGAVESLFAAQGLSQWRGRRPQTLVWLVTQQDGERYVEGSDGDSEIFESLREAAAGRGIELTAPLHDLQDQRALTPSDLWGNFADAISDASARYGTGVVLVGRLQRSGSGAWSGRWTVYQGDERDDWENNAATAGQLAAGAVAVHADRLAALYATAPVAAAAATGPADSAAATPGGSGGAAGGPGGQGMPGGGGVILRLRGIDGFDEYLRISTYLEGLGVVAAADPVMLERDRAEFKLRLNGDVSGLQRVLAVERVLMPLPEDGAGAGAGPGTGVAGRLPVYESVR